MVLPYSSKFDKCLQEEIATKYFDECINVMNLEFITYECEAIEEKVYQRNG